MGQRWFALLGVVLCTTLCVGCGVSDDDVEQEIRRTKNVRADTIRAELESMIRRASASLDDLAKRFEHESAPATQDAQFDVVESVRHAHDVSGLMWEGPGGDAAWAGRPVEARSLPASHAWSGSFRTGNVTYQEGPFVRALLVGPREIQGGYATASVVLEELAPEDGAKRAFTDRWLQPLSLWAVELRPPGSVVDADATSPVIQAEVAWNNAPAVEVHLHDLEREAIRERLQGEHDQRIGIMLLLLLATLVAAGCVALVRAKRLGRARWLLGIVLVLAARAAIRLIDLPHRFSTPGTVFSPNAFAIDTPLGWLSSPADFALTSIAYVLVAAFFRAAIRQYVRPSSQGFGRFAIALGSTAVAGTLIALWITVVIAAVRGGEIAFFRTDSFWPSATASLMLFAVVASTAGALVAVEALLDRALACNVVRPRWIARIVMGLLAGAVAWFLSTDALQARPVVFAMSLLAAWMARVDTSRSRVALPSRILLTSVLGTVLAFPVLFAHVGYRDAEALGREVKELVRAEDRARSEIEFALEDARRNDELIRALERAQNETPEEGLALHVWQRSDLLESELPSVVTILDREGREIDAFTLSAIPRRMIPTPKPPTRKDNDVEVFTARRERNRIRSIVGRTRLRNPAGDVVGHAVITVPDLLDLKLRPLGEQVLTRTMLSDFPLSYVHRLQFALLRNGRVEVCNDPTIARREGQFGPDALNALTEGTEPLAWQDDESFGYAVWNEARGHAVAVKAPKPRGGQILLALARVLLVGVGMGAVIALLWWVATMRGFTWRMHHKILLSYFLISIIPLVLLGLASARDTKGRFEARMSQRIATDLARVRTEFERMGTSLFSTADNDHLERGAMERRHDVLLYRGGYLEASSRIGLVRAELLSPRLPPEVFRATHLDQRQIVQKQADYAGRPVWFGYAPVLDGRGRTRAVVGVPLLYDRDRMDEELSVTGSVLLAGYLLTMVLVLLGGMVAARSIARPMQLLAQGTKRVAGGDLDVKLPEGGGDEVGELVRSFNKMTEELRSTTDRAVRAEREAVWREMARQVAHEIKNPLTPMRLMIQQLEADIREDPTRAKEALKRTTPIVLRQIEDLSRIASDFANFARMPQREKTRIDVPTVVRDITALYAASKTEGINVHCHVDEDLPPLMADEQEFRRVLINLVRNAIQAMKGGGEIELRAVNEAMGPAPGMLLTIRDTGTGIDDETRKRLFEPHFSTKSKGMGLGLSMVKRFVDDSGGVIQVKTAPGEGSSFVLWWPLIADAGTLGSSS